MKYPEIITKFQEQPSSVTLRLFISKDIVFFQGHFPDTQILPGIAQIDWAFFFASKFLNIERENFLTIEQLKFTHIIKPDTTLSLTLSLENNILTFKYFNDDITYSIGKIKS